MKYIYTLTAIILLLASTPAIAQTDEQLTIAAEKSCECLKDKGLENMDKDELEMTLGLCILANAKDIINTDDPDGNGYDIGKELGEKLGMKMVTICPEPFMKIAAMESGGKKLTGTITEVKTGDVVVVMLKESDKTMHKLLWLEPVEDGDKWTSDPKKLVGKQVTVKYRTADVYSYTSKDYETQKVLVKLSDE